MPPPRLAPQLEHRFAKAACGLPPRVQRLLAGTGPRVEGQELAPDMRVLLRLAELTGAESVTEGASPQEARARNRASAAAVAGPPRPLDRVEDLEVPGPAGTIPARLYAATRGDGGSSAPGAGGAGPPQGEPPPLLVYYHGGGWVLGDLDSHDSVCRFLAGETGARVLSVDYRLAPEHRFPAAVDDALAAFRWAAAQASELAAHPARVAVGGDSAGGNLAAAVGLLTREEGARPAMQLLIYPVTDTIGEHASRRLFSEGFLLSDADMDWFEAHYLPDDGAREDPRVSVLRAEDLSGLPPACVVTAGFDPLRDEGEAYAERMRAAGVRVALRRHPGLVHSFANMTAISRSARAAMHEVAGALRMGLS